MLYNRHEFMRKIEYFTIIMQNTVSLLIRAHISHIICRVQNLLFSRMVNSIFLNWPIPFSSVLSVKKKVDQYFKRVCLLIISWDGWQVAGQVA